MSPGLSELLLLLLVIGAIGVAAIVIRMRRRARSSMAAALGVGGLEPGRGYRDTLDGTDYEYRYREASRNRPSELRVRIDCPSRGDFRVSGEGRLDRLFKRLGIAIELQTGDADFDRRFYLHSDSVGFCRACFGEADAREAVRRLAALGWREIRHDGRTLEARRAPFDAEAARVPDLLQGTVRGLAALAAHLPREWYEPTALGVPAWRVHRALVYALAIGSVVVGLGAVLWGRIAYPPLDELDAILYSLRYSGAGLLAFTVLAVALLRGRSSSHKELLLSGGLALVGIPLCGAGGLLLLNGYGDISPAVVHEALATGKHVTHSRNSRTYHVGVRSWRPRHRSEDIEVSHSTYARVQAGRTVMRLTTRAGRYGFEWLQGYAIRE